MTPTFDCRPPCPVGQERHERCKVGGKAMIAYDYRTEDGVPFFTIAPTLKVARERRDEWVAAGCPRD